MAVGLFILALVRTPDEAPLNEESQPLFRVEVESRIATPYVPVTILRGVTKGNREVTFFSATEGILKARPVKNGDLVKEGAIIAEIDLEDKEALLQEAESLLAQRKAELEASQSLSKKGHRSAIDEKRAIASHAAAEARTQTIKNEIEKRIITAPFDGILFNENADEGQYLRKGDVIASLVSLSPLTIEADASEQDMPYIEKGQKATVRLNNGRLLPAFITYKAPATTSQARTFRIEAQARNDNHDTQSGFSVELIIERHAVNAHHINGSLLSLDDKGQLGVKIVDDNNNVRFVAVRPVGEDTKGLWVTGLPERITLITRGQGFVLDGAQVDIKNRGTPSQSKALAF